MIQRSQQAEVVGHLLGEDGIKGGFKTLHMFQIKALFAKPGEESRVGVFTLGRQTDVVVTQKGVGVHQVFCLDDLQKLLLMLQQ